MTLCAAREARLFRGKPSPHWWGELSLVQEGCARGWRIAARACPRCGEGDACGSIHGVVNDVVCLEGDELDQGKNGA